MNAPFEVAVGTRLPELTIELTPTFVISAALATRDFQPIHHDHAAARRAGTDDVFANAYTTIGLLGRLITDWAGPACRITSVAVKLGRPAIAGRTLRVSGEVTEVQAGGDGHEIVVAVTGRTEDGVHVTGDVHARLPASPATR